MSDQDKNKGKGKDKTPVVDLFAKIVTLKKEMDAGGGYREGEDKHGKPNKGDKHNKDGRVQTPVGESPPASAPFDFKPLAVRRPKGP